MIKARRTLAIFLLPAFLAQIAVATPLELSFEDAVLMARDRPASVVMSHERVQQAVARLAQARSSLLPQVTANASEQRRTVNLAAQGIEIPNINPKVGPFNTFDARLKLTQELFDAETLEALRFARTGQALAIEQKRKQQQDTMALVATLFIEAERAQEQIQLGNTLKWRDEKESALAHAQLALGTTTQIDVDVIDARLQDTEHFLTAVQAQAVERRLDLVAALDLPVDQPIVFKETPLIAPTDNPAAVTVTDVDAQPDVAVARQTVEQRQASAGVIKAGYAPKVTAEADYGASGKLPSDSFGTYNFGGMLSLPIFEGGSRQKRVDEAQHQVQESQIALEDAKIQTQAKVLSASEAVKSSWAAFQSRHTTLMVADKQLMLAQQRQQEGVGTLMGLVEETARNAQVADDAREAEATYQTARVTLAQSLGHMESLVNKQ